MFDGAGVVRFRVLNAIIWTLAGAFGGLGALVIAVTDVGDSLPMFVLAVSFIGISRVFEGLGKGGGAIAWNLGHLHFAAPAKAEIYMGIHVFLTGLRGIVAPFLGTLLYMTIGPGAFAVAVSSSLIGVMMFVSLARREARLAADAKPHADTPGDSTIEEINDAPTDVEPQPALR
jgi:hypothetical protein